jgi:hypothetical protein
MNVRSSFNSVNIANTTTLQHTARRAGKMKVAVCALALLCLAAAANAEIIGDITMAQRSAELQSQAVIAAKANSTTTAPIESTTGSSVGIVDISDLPLPLTPEAPEDAEEEGTTAAAAVTPKPAAPAKPAPGKHHLPYPAAIDLGSYYSSMHS